MTKSFLLLCENKSKSKKYFLSQVKMSYKQK